MRPSVRLPSAFSKKCPWQVAKAATLSMLVTACGFLLATAAPMWAWPLGWVTSGVGLFGFMVLAHDAGHAALFRKVWMNDLAGHLFGLPILQPFVPMQVLHARHHRHLNHIDKDPTWKPWSKEKYEAQPLPVRALYRWMRQGLWWLGTVFNLFVFHFDLSQLPRSKRAAGAFSMAFTVSTGALVVAAAYRAGGAAMVLSGLLAPWLVLNLIFSTITLLQHTYFGDRPIVWHDHDEAANPLTSTVHLELPCLVATLFHNINYHVPHHLNPGVPFYRLPEAHAWLKAQGMRPIETVLDVAALRTVLASTHLFDPKTQTFAAFGGGSPIREGTS